tara:strand:+ start:5586 stop:5822 length:237 start_codon:yes stop_codon:yes gene_type:complete
MYSKTAISNLRRVIQGCRQISSALMDLKKVSTAAIMRSRLSLVSRGGEETHPQIETVEGEMGQNRYVKMEPMQQSPIR